MDKILAFAALLPTVIAMVYIYKKDAVEKEPALLLFGLVVLGALSTRLAAVLENCFCAILEQLLDTNRLGYVVIENFFIIAFTEELLKYLCVRMIAWRNKAFNYRFDAVIYCTFAALGFAALENVFYVQRWGLSVAIARAVLTIPLHAFCGVSMGLFMGHAKAYEVVANFKMKRRYLIYSVVVPTVLHGFYDFCLIFSIPLMTLVFIIFVIALYVFSIQKIHKAAAEDCPLCANWKQPFQKMQKSNEITIEIEKENKPA